MSRHVRLYRRLVRLYPARFHQQFGDEMVVLFADQLRDARASGRRLAVVGLWTRSLLDLVVTAPTQYLRAERAVQQTVEVGIAIDGPSAPPSRVATIVAATPLLTFALLSIVAPGFMDPVYSKPPEVIGVPGGVILILVACALAVLGMAVVRRSRSGIVGLLGIAFLSLPAWILIVLAPAAVLIVQNLAV